MTYNLKTEIPEFVSHFQQRERLGLDNHWIVKAWNLARGLDMHISPHLHHILRLPFSGPKIAQKYVVGRGPFSQHSAKRLRESRT